MGASASTVPGGFEMPMQGVRGAMIVIAFYVVCGAALVVAHRMGWLE